MSDGRFKVATAKRLKMAREFSGLSQAQVARMMDMHRPTVSEIEAGRRRVPAEELRSFASLYSVSIAWLVGESKEKLAVEDSRLELAARELTKLKPADLEKLLNLLAALRVTTS